MHHWYIAKIRSGFGRICRTVIEGGQQRDLSIVERQLEEKGFDHYFPRMRKEIRHHRTKKLIERRFPLFAGYVFVGMPSANPDLYSLAQCRGVAYVLGVDGHPWRVPAAEIERLRADEVNMVFDDTREARLKRREEGQTRRETIAMQYPTGAEVRVSEGPFAGFHGHVTGVTGKGHVKAMLDLFGRLTPCEFEAVDLEAA